MTDKVKVSWTDLFQGLEALHHPHMQQVCPTATILYIREGSEGAMYSHVVGQTFIFEVPHAAWEALQKELQDVPPTDRRLVLLSKCSIVRADA